MNAMSRRAFLKAGAATATALALGSKYWGWATPESPFGPLRDDPIIRLPEGFTYKIVAETHMPLQGGRGPFERPPFPDLNVVFPQTGGKLLLATSHEIPSEFPGFAANPPGEEYDRIASGAVTSLLLNPDLSVSESAYHAGGMITNCSGSGTPWGTVLTGEEATSTFEAPHGYVWEVDLNAHTKVRLDACGRFDHETAVVDPVTGYVYLTEDSGTALLYRLRPHTSGQLHLGGVLEAYRPGGTWATIDDPSGTSLSTRAQGVAKGALTFQRLEGGRFDGRLFYFAETEDDTSAGRVWRLNVDTGSLELWAAGSMGGAMVMPDNLAFDMAGNVFVTEDRSSASLTNVNRVVYIDRQTGALATFAELVQKFFTPGSINIADEPTGPAFTPDGTVMFLNLQRELFGITIAISGPFATTPPAAPVAALPKLASAEGEAVASLGPGFLRSVGLPFAAAVGLLNLRRRELVGNVPEPIENLAEALGPPPKMAEPKRRDSASGD